MVALRHRTVAFFTGFDHAVSADVLVVANADRQASVTDTTVGVGGAFPFAREGLVCFTAIVAPVTVFSGFDDAVSALIRSEAERTGPANEPRWAIRPVVAFELAFARLARGAAVSLLIGTVAGFTRFDNEIAADRGLNGGKVDASRAGQDQHGKEGKRCASHNRSSR